MAYESRQFKIHEQNYPTHDLELVAIVCALKCGGVIYMEKSFRFTLIIKPLNIFSLRKISIFDKDIRSII